MHYCCLIITEKFPTDDILDQILKPYNEEDFYFDGGEKDYPLIMWDWWEIGGRYGGQIKLKVDKDDEKYQWPYIIREPRNNRLFRSRALSIVEKIKDLTYIYEDDFFNYMGYQDGYIYVDAAKISDIINLNDLGCFCFIDRNNKAYTRSYYNHGNFTEYPDFDEKLRKTLQDSLDCYVCIVDLHE